MWPGVLVAVAVAVPLASFVLMRLGSVRITERHHSRHDTYVIPVAFTRSLVHMMAFMGAMGLFLGWLCSSSVFVADPPEVLAFFDAFIVTTFTLWLVLTRYKVSTFEGHMIVTPFVGHDVVVRYDQIERMEWAGFRKGSGYRDLDVWVGGSYAVRLSALVDLEQILMSIDRFDVLPSSS